jgi:hypothetical protein
MGGGFAVPADGSDHEATIGDKTEPAAILFPVV